MKQSDYIAIRKFLRTQHKVPCHEVLKKIEIVFPHLNLDSLISIVLAWYAEVVKRQNPRKKCNTALYERYLCKVAESDPKSKPTVIEVMSQEMNLPPSMVAKFVLSKYVEKETQVENCRNETNRLFRNPFLIKDQRLSAEVRRSLLIDSAYGPVIAVIRELIGVEHEEKLKAIVENMNIKCQNENTMRKEGYDKTPDLRLIKPMVVDGEFIYWIESKALFACPETHQKYFVNQYKCYLNRYGPGLVIYWYGYVENLAEEALKNKIIIRDSFPKVVDYSNKPHLEEFLKKKTQRFVPTKK